MAIYAELDTAGERLDTLVAAAQGGEHVFLTRSGVLQVRLVPVAQPSGQTAEEIAAKRRSALGMYAHLVGDRDLDIARIKREDVDYQAAITRKYGDAD